MVRPCGKGITPFRGLTNHGYKPLASPGMIFQVPRNLGGRKLTMVVYHVSKSWDDPPSTLSPRKIQHTPRAHPFGNPLYPTMKGFPLQPIGKGLGMCSSSVCLNNLRPRYPLNFFSQAIQPSWLQKVCLVMPGISELKGCPLQGTNITYPLPFGTFEVDDFHFPPGWGYVIVQFPGN